IACIDRELYANRAGIEGMAQHQQLCLRIDEARAHVRTQECSANLHTTVLCPGCKVSRYADHPTVRQATNNVGQKLSWRRDTIGRPVLVEACTHWIDEQDRPRFRVAIDSGPNIFLMLGPERFDLYEATLDREKRDFHA